jgi:hypothetical protein
MTHGQDLTMIENFRALRPHTGVSTRRHDLKSR